MTRSSHTYVTALTQTGRERLLPLPVVILPGGRQRVRVIDAAYIDLITEALKQEKNFVIAFDVDGLPPPYQWGTYARVVNFDLTEEQFLLLNVEAVALVSLTDGGKNSHGEWTAVAHYISYWTMLNSKVDTGKYSAVLRKLFKSYPQISNLYSDTYFDSIEWVCSRLIELLPVPDSARKTLLKYDDFQSVVSFLDTIIDDNHDFSDPNTD